MQLGVVYFFLRQEGLVWSELCLRPTIEWATFTIFKRVRSAFQAGTKPAAVSSLCRTYTVGKLWPFLQGIGLKSSIKLVISGFA